MKHPLWLGLLILVSSATAHGFQTKTEILEQFDSLKMAAFVDPKEISRSPEWNPNAEEPPLTVAEAIRAVQELNEDAGTMGAVKEIEIRQFPNDEKHWHYLIKVANKRMKTKYNIYVVLMNGKVIPAMIEPQSYK